jgi:hypothetical protein
MLLMAALGTTAITLTTFDSEISSNYRSAVQSMYAAETGIKHMMTLYRTDPSTFTNTQSASDMGLSTAKPDAVNLPPNFVYWVSNLAYEGSVPPQYVDITSNGSVIGTPSLSRITVRLAYEPGGEDFGIVAVDKIRISGGLLDSYNACNGAYDSVTNSGDVEVITNATAEDSIDMSGDAMIRGDAVVGPGGDPEEAINADLSAITGDRRAATELQDATPVVDPGGGTPLVPTFPGDIETVPGGTYRVAGDLSVPGGKEMHITSAVTLIIEDKFTTSGSGKVVIQSGASLTVYVAGDATFSGSAIVNTDQDPKDFMLYSTLNKKVTVSGSGAFYGRIYAPQSDVTVSGDGNIYGGLFGYSITNSGGAGLHADECGTGTGGGDPFRVVFWRKD